METIVTTVGVSLFENFMTETGKDLGRYLELTRESHSYSKKWRDKREYILGEDGKSKWWYQITSHPYFKKADTKLSAEITSIRKIVESEKNRKVGIHLIASDTVLSVAAALFIKEWFGQAIIQKRYPEIIEVKFHLPHIPFERQEQNNHVAKELNVKNPKGFKRGIVHLFEILDGISNKLILNITGGYKAIAPVLTMYGQLYGIPVKYIYDENRLDQSRLITMGSLPFNFDWEVVEALADVLDEKTINNLDKRSPVFKDLLSLNICRYERGRVELTIIADLMKRYINYASAFNRGILGVYLEYQLYYYFSQRDSGEYYVNPQKLKIENLYYSEREEKLKLIEKQPDGYHEVGDIDLMLSLRENSSQKALCEIKAFSSFKRYWEEKENGRDYFDRQIKPRILYFSKEYDIAEFHLYVYKASFRDRKKRIPIAADRELTNLVNYFVDRLQQDEQTRKVRLNVRGFHIDLSKKGLNINYSSLLGKPFDKIEWEYIYPKNAPNSKT